MNVIWASACILVGYVGQELAHYVCCEKTYQSEYQGQEGWMSLLLEHTYYLLPLVFDSAHRMHYSLLDFMVQHNRVYKNKLKSEGELKDLKHIEDWVLAQNPSKDHTTHWWFEELPKDVKVCVSS